MVATLSFLWALKTHRTWAVAHQNLNLRQQTAKTAAMNGWIIINKPLGVSSAQVVGKVKWLLKLKSLKKKIGHAGTLDPLATGVLPLAVGECTKVVQFLTDADKTYEFEVTWGEERSTDDAEGEVISSSEQLPTNEQINKVVNEFLGEIEQMPPQYSALKVDGQRAYDVARSGGVADIKTRKVTIHKIEILDIAEKSASFRVSCSKGTYIRSIARDMGRLLGCYGYVSKLHRTGHGKFDINQSISLEKLIDMCEKGDEQQAILPVDDILDDIPELKLKEDEARKVRNGIVLNIDAAHNISDADLVKVYHDNTLLAIAEISDSKLTTRRVFNL